MMGSVFDRVRRVAADLFGLPLAEVSAGSSPETIEAWDSMQHLNLVLALEQTFGVRFSPDEIEQMSSVGSIVASLESKSANTEAAKDLADANSI